MNNLTKMIISRPAHELFEAFVDPSKIGKFWFSSSSKRWEQGRVVALGYDEYNAQVDITLLEIEPNRKIVYRWGNDGRGNVVTITLEEEDSERTLITVSEEGFEADADHLIETLLDNKEGWVYMLTCLKGYLEYGAILRAALIQ